MRPQRTSAFGVKRKKLPSTCGSNASFDAPLQMKPKLRQYSPPDDSDPKVARCLGITATPPVEVRTRAASSSLP